MTETGTGVGVGVGIRETTGELASLPTRTSVRTSAYAANFTVRISICDPRSVSVGVLGDVVATEPGLAACRRVGAIEGGLRVEHAAAWHTIRGIITLAVMTILVSSISCDGTNASGGACASQPVIVSDAIILGGQAVSSISRSLVVEIVTGSVARRQRDALTAR